MDEKIFSDLDHKIVKLFSKKDLEPLELVKYGLFPLHLAVMTSSTELVDELLNSYGAKLDVKCCGDPNSPFHALTPLELAFQILRNLTPWTPHQSLHDLLCMLHANAKVKLLIPNISHLLSVTPGIRHLISNYSLQGKVVELAVSLTTPLSHGINFSTMYISTANVPPELHFGVNGILRMLVASRSASLIKEAIHLSGSLNNEEYDNCTRKIKEMDCVRTLLELAERGDLNNFDVKQQLNVQLTDGSTEGSQEHNLTADESKVNTVAPQYLKNCLLYVEPSKFQPCGAFNSLDWSSFPSQELCPLRMIIENDNADEFNSFLRKSKIVFQMDDVLLKYAGFQICPYGILGKICHHRASKCATLLLSRRRKLGSMMNLNILNCYRSYPLHDAAITLSPTLVKILLDRGASLDARSWDQAGISPLEYAVERFSCDTNLIEWSPKKSVFKLIIALCLPQMKEALETIDLLAGVSANSTVMFDTIFSAVKRGQVVSVAVLLLLARDRVMQSHFFATNISRSTYMPFLESIMNELSALMNQESALMGCKEHSKILQLCREKELMMYFLQMIEIFNRAGTDLKSYLETRTSDVTNEQVSYHVAGLLKEAGFILSTNDSDISDITSSPKLGQVPLDATVKQQEYEDDPEGIFFKPCREQLCRCDMKIPSCTTSNVFQRIVGPTLLHNHHRGFSSRAGPSIDQPLCTVPRRNICFLSRLPNVFGEVGPCDKSGDNVSLQKQQITVKLTDDSLEGSKDESKANTVAPQYLKNSLFYVEPSKFQPSGLFKSPMPRGRIAALKAGFKAFEHVDVKKISASVFSFIK